MRKISAVIVIVALAFGLISGPVSAQDKPSPAEQRHLFRRGAELWPIYCNNCHNARPGSEKAPYEWDQIMIHMRTVGNIPPDDARAILQYLKAR